MLGIHARGVRARAETVIREGPAEQTEQRRLAVGCGDHCVRSVLRVIGELNHDGTTVPDEDLLELTPLVNRLPGSGYSVSSELETPTPPEVRPEGSR